MASLDSVVAIGITTCQLRSGYFPPLSQGTAISTAPTQHPSQLQWGTEGLMGEDVPQNSQVSWDAVVAMEITF